MKLTEVGRELVQQLVAEARAHDAQLLGAPGDTDAARIKPVLKSMLAQLKSP